MLRFSPFCPGAAFFIQTNTSAYFVNKDACTELIDPQTTEVLPIKALLGLKQQVYFATVNKKSGKGSIQQLNMFV